MLHLAKPRKILYEEEEAEPEVEETNDSDYNPNDGDSASSSSNEEENIKTPSGIAEILVNEKKYMVLESSVHQLVSWVCCNRCNNVLIVDDDCPFGTVKGLYVDN